MTENRLYVMNKYRGNIYCIIKKNDLETSL